MTPTFAVLQQAPEPVTTEQLRAAFRTVPGVPAVDADRLCQGVFGVLARNLNGAQANALQAGLRAQNIESEVLAETSLPPLPPAKTLRRLEFTPEALVVFDPLGRKFPVEWSHVALLAAGSVDQASFKRAREEKVIDRIGFVHGVVPVHVREVKVQYSTQESAQSVLRGEIVLTKGVARYEIEAENFNYTCLPSAATRETAVDFCALMREFVTYAPHAKLGRSLASIMAEPPGFVPYPKQRALDDEVVWELWRMK